MRHTKVIGDGDSSVLYTIKTTIQSYSRDAVKIECGNHAVRCYHSRLEQLVKDLPSFHGQGGLTKSTIMEIIHGAHCAIHNHSIGNDIAKLRNNLHGGSKTLARNSSSL